MYSLYRPFNSSVRFDPIYFIFLEAIVNGISSLISQSIYHLYIQISLHFFLFCVCYFCILPLWWQDLSTVEDFWWSLQGLSCTVFYHLHVRILPLLSCLDLFFSFSHLSSLVDNKELNIFLYWMGAGDIVILVLSLILVTMLELISPFSKILVERL